MAAQTSKTGTKFVKYLPLVSHNSKNARIPSPANTGASTISLDVFFPFKHIAAHLNINKYIPRRIPVTKCLY